MRKQFIECENLDQAYKIAPWATVIVKVTDGYRAFESCEDWHIWEKQS